VSLIVHPLYNPPPGGFEPRNKNNTSSDLGQKRALFTPQAKSIAVLQCL
jgi:hypothetical protein